MDFFPRDPEKQLVEVKALLTSRLMDLRTFRDRLFDQTAFDDREAGHMDGRVDRLFDEIEFLSDLLDKLERS